MIDPILLCLSTCKDHWVYLFEKKEKRVRSANIKSIFDLKHWLEGPRICPEYCRLQFIERKKEKEMEAVHVQAIGLSPIYSIDPISCSRRF